ncbi:MAG: nuclear transport factor 2 family protein [Kiloniellales bacterium]|nr:nuclear transport factor 2 family protein [Kiloniellales bacterium]
MPEQDLIDRMAAVYTAYNEGDAEPFFSLVANDGLVRFVAPPETYPFAAPHRGPKGAREAIALIADDYQWLTFRNLELIAEGDTLFALNGGRIRHRASGREAVMHMGDLVRFKDGRIVEFVEFFDSAGLLDWCAGICLPACSHMNPGNKASACAPEEAAANKAVLAEVYAAYAKKDAGPLFERLADDACYNSVAGLKDFRFAGPCHGREAMIENVGRIAEDYALEKLEVLDMIAQDDLVAVHADVAFRDRKTGQLAGSEKIDLFRLHNGKILEFNEFFDTLAVRSAYEPR